MNLLTPLPDDRRGRRDITIVRVPAGQTLYLHVAATRAATTWTHYTDRRTMPCGGDRTHCPYCALGLVRRFEAYLAAETLPRRQRVVVAIPALAWARLSAALGPAADGGLWGWRIELSRPSGDIRQQIRIGDCRPHVEGESRPAGIDTPGVLRRAWGTGQG